MVQTCPVVKWWSENRTKNVKFANGLPNHVYQLFKNLTKKVS